MNRIVVPIALLILLPIFGLAAPFFISGIGGNSDLEAIGTLSHLWSYVLGAYISSTLLLVLGVGLGIFILGVGNAWIIASYDFPGKKIFEWALILPLAVPTYVMAYLFVDLLQFSGPIQTTLRTWLGMNSLWFFPDPRSLSGAIWSFSFCLFPYVYLITRTAFMERSSRLMEVSETLGYSAFQGFFKLVLPMARPAIFAGMALALMEVLADFGAVSYFGVQTFTTGIFKAWLSFGDRLAAVQLALSLLGIVLLIFFIEQSSRSKLRFASAAQGKSLPKYLRGKAAFFAFSFCGATLLCGFILPAAALIQLLLKQGLSVDIRYLSWLSNSVSVASITALISVLLALFFAYAVRLNSGLSWVTRLLGFGYALPGAVLAIGILSILEIMQLAWWISASMMVLVYAYLVRFLSSSLQSVEEGLNRITPSMDQSAALLGFNQWQILQKVHIPLIRRSLVTAGLFVFVDVMKELPATLLLRPFNFDTLAVATYQLAADERLSELGLPALTIVLAGLIPVLVLSRMISRNQ
jgi:iron(III) transport system permease protein